ncbi:hypothetical protein [Streptomyces sp. B1I3]|uniref:hypothetical protein n=1 Tax=Streptomyces sp. B1I3 TaxID=3042264 RepID=UPI0027889941|nr:hypothetical protein [Streptomyces sp. B1I3]MDQ0792014.1 hypothetical protein [Streptomyces sp. B1I3]
MTTQTETAEYRWTAHYLDGATNRSTTDTLTVPANLTENEIRARAWEELRSSGRPVGSYHSLTITPTHQAKQPLGAKQEVFFEITTLDGAVYRMGQPAPTGTVTTDTGENIPAVVQSYEMSLDWVEIKLSDGYEVAFPEARISRTVTRTL